MTKINKKNIHIHITEDQYTTLSYKLLNHKIFSI